MMHVRFSLVAADPPVLAGCIGYLEDEARPVVESQHGSLGLALLEEPGVVIFESFWATHEALWLSEETEAVFRGELARRVERPVKAEDYQVAVFEREGPPGKAVRLTRMEVKRRESRTWLTCTGTPRSRGWPAPPVSARRCCSPTRPTGS